MVPSLRKNLRKEKRKEKDKAPIKEVLTDPDTLAEALVAESKELEKSEGQQAED